MEALAIAPDTVVTLSYVLFDQHGEAVDEVGKADPLTYVHGYAQLVPGLERQIEGLKPGERGVFTVDADEAFGDRDDEAVFEVEVTAVRAASEDEIAEAQAELEALASEQGDACGCGHDHGGEDHHHDHDHSEVGLIQLAKKS